MFATVVMVGGLLAGLVGLASIPLFFVMANLMSAPEPGSVIGLTVDEEGRMTAAVAVCKGEADMLDLAKWSISQKAGDRIREWPISADGGLRLVQLAEDGSVGRAEQLGIDLDQGAMLSAYYSTRWGSDSLVFYGADLQAVREGQVWLRGTPGGEQEGEEELIPVDTFHAVACERLAP
ncbi:hypothetical protein [Aquipuribacter sp. MA13-6]|uniref:hypothetical protein n=1 Tax=unclassified Aquipuribacter TaxID=2635084 RepID=UPI003EF08561